MPHSPLLKFHQAAPCPPLQSYPVKPQTLARAAVHHNVNQEGKRVNLTSTISHLEECLGSEEQPKALPRKEAGTGARTQAPF